jgi:hypothetical protein
MQLDVHHTSRRIERAYESIRSNRVLPESEKQKIFAFDQFLAAKQIGEKRRLVSLHIHVGKSSKYKGRNDTDSQHEEMDTKVVTGRTAIYRSPSEFRTEICVHRC